MSSLKVGPDDHPEAALKHLTDASVLLTGGRFDGASYLSGYVVESALKSVLLHDHCANAAGHDPSLLKQHHDKLKYKPFGHDLTRLALANLTGPGVNYWPGLSAGSAGSPPSILKWNPESRYWPGGLVSQTEAEAHLAWAEFVAKASVVRMTLDGVI